VRLANGHPGFYLAVPVEAHRFSGDVSRLESRSAMVGLIDAQAFATQALAAGTSTPALRLRDGVTSLASLGSGPHHLIRGSLQARNRPWAVAVGGQSLTPLERALPWLIVVVGLGLALAVGLVVIQAARRRDEALRLAQARTRQLEEAHAEALRRSREDPLTGIFNRRHFGEALASELARARRGGAPPALLLLDLDHFKAVNDAHGHLTGDAVLCATAERIASVLRSSDCLARWGGEEFAILAPDIDADGAVALAERARLTLTERPIEVDGLSIRLTLSVGVAIAVREDTPDGLVHAADRALYEAKRAGRNRVRQFDPATPALST
jgi:diguanylate cyclase (GGDEF)-like protein